MTISSPTFQRLQDGIKSVDDLRVRGPVNAALAWLSGDLVDQLNTKFNSVDATLASISASLSDINSRLNAISQSVSVQIAAAIASHISTIPNFKANKGTVNQTSISASITPLTFSTEVWDAGSYFAANAWTPPGGFYHFVAAVLFTNANAVDNEDLTVGLLKNGAVDSRFIWQRNGTGQAGRCVVFKTFGNGTDAFQLYATKSGAGVGTVDGGVLDTWFSGEMLS